MFFIYQYLFAGYFTHLLSKKRLLVFNYRVCDLPEDIAIVNVLWFVSRHWCEQTGSKKGQRKYMHFTFVTLHSWLQTLGKAFIVSLCICNTKFHVWASAYLMEQWSQDSFYLSVLGLICKPEKTQSQLKIALLISSEVKETFPKVASKPWLSAHCWQISLHCSASGCACCSTAMKRGGKLCQLTQWVVQEPHAYALGGQSAKLCHLRYWQQTLVLAELKNPINYSL